MEKSKFKIMAVFLFVLILVAACSTGNSSPKGNEDTPPGSETPNAETPKTEPPAAQEPVIDKPTQLTVYHAWGMTTEQFMDLWGKYIVKKYPNVSFQVLNQTDGNLDNLILTGTNVDLVINSDSNMQYIKDLGLNSDISDLIKKHNYDLGSWDPSVAKFIQEFNDGEIPGLPYSLQTMAMYYNKDLFDKFGVPFPSDNLTWDDVQELNRTLTRNDGDMMYWGYDTRNSPNLFALNQLSLPIIDPTTEKAVFDTDPWRNYMGKMVDVVQIHGVEPFPGNKLDLFVKEQQLAMVSTMSSNFEMLDQNPDLNWDVTKYPTLKELPDVGPQAQITLFYIPVNSKYKEEAFLSVAELTTFEVQRELSKEAQMSILQDPEMRSVFGTNLAGLRGKNTAAFIPTQFAANIPYSKYTNIANTELNNAYLALIAGAKDLNTAFRDAIEAANKKIDELKQTEAK